MKIFKKYAFRKYSKDFPSLFNKEKVKLRRVLEKNVLIEHVGSTSIPGLGGKGIIDIAIKTPKGKCNQFIKKLEELGYEQKDSHQANENRIFLQKIIKSSGKERRIHIHLVLNDHFWITFIAFRDYLRTHDKERKEYAKIKQEAVKKGLEGEEYRKHKNDFLENLTKRALNEKKIELRLATKKDAEELIKIIRLADNRTEENARTKVDKYINSKIGFFILATEKEKIIGYVLFKITDEDEDSAKLINLNDYSSICWIAVLPEFRKLHIGSKLIDESMKYAKKYKKKGLWLGCRDDVLGFYQKNGFKNIGNFPRASSSGRIKPCYVMVKEKI